LQLCVSDIAAARSQLDASGVEVARSSISETAALMTRSSSSRIPTATTGLSRRCRRTGRLQTRLAEQGGTLAPPSGPSRGGPSWETTAVQPHGSTGRSRPAACSLPSCRRVSSARSVSTRRSSSSRLPRVRTHPARNGSRRAGSGGGSPRPTVWPVWTRRSPPRPSQRSADGGTTSRTRLCGVCFGSRRREKTTGEASAVALERRLRRGWLAGRRFETTAALPG
jgi:hypothetical protein